MRKALLAWTSVGVALALLARVSREQLGFLAFVIEASWVATGLAIIGAALFRARKPEVRRRHVLFVVAVVLGCLVFVPLARIGNEITVRTRFSSQRAAYDGIVAREQANPSGEGEHESDGLRYVVDPGPPVRIAFMWPGGVVDNWCAAVHDPTAAVVDHNLEPVRHLFGGDLFYCQELEAPYYQCCFT